MSLSQKMIGRFQYIAIILAWAFVPLAFAASVEQVKELQFSFVTFGLCLAGWFLSWSSEWIVEYQQQGKCFTVFVLNHLPRLVIGLVSAGVCYVLLPDITSLVGAGGKVGAFLCGLASDFIVQRLRGLIPPPRQQE